MSGFKLSSRELEKLVKYGKPQPQQLDSLIFVMFLEGSSEVDPTWSNSELIIDKLVQFAQPRPIFTHCELFVPSDNRSDDLHFATYFGLQAGWGKSFGGQRNFYLGHNATLWRAVPVAYNHASSKVREECKKHELTPYSILRYLCSAPPLRAFASFLDDRVGAPAHCATLTARILNNAISGIGLSRPSAWYGPSTLFLETQSSEMKSKSNKFLTETESVKSLVEEEEHKKALHSLLYDPDEIVMAQKDGACLGAIQLLAHRALELGLDETGHQVVQRQLAKALLRYSVVKRSGN